ncbi:GNAT family N-acetyltransferase [Thermaurantimonas aggregans]|nr:GNAT family N-acetyltransferase [Thermaurantimonas aggregans]MCX8149536.1 GNAT family N-acetyltransferase [Thermaurantimonas aggregans]
MIKEVYRFSELSAAKLYEILRIRNEIFVVEQQSVYNDTDGHDLKALHYTYWQEGELIAYSRILPRYTVYPLASIGRVCVRKPHRGQGFGRTLFSESLEILESTFGKQPIKIQAQLYLKTFYESFGFRSITDAYDDCGILHVDMVKD